MEDLPKNFDWRVKGVMPQVKDQLFCGSCWAFAATACLEAHINIDRVLNQNKTLPLITLSEQSTVDCFHTKPKPKEWRRSDGCQGGDESNLMNEWASSKRYKFATEHEYPYLGQNDWCKNESIHGYEEYVVTERHKVPPNNIV